MSDHLEETVMEDWSELRTGLIFIYEGPVDTPYLKQKYHIPGQAAFLMRQGQVSITTREGTVQAKEGDWVFPKEGSRLQEFSKDSRVLSLRFKLTWPWGQPLYEYGVALVARAEQYPRLEQEGTKLLRLVQEVIPRGGMFYRYARSNVDNFLLTQQQLLAWLNVYTQVVSELGYSPSSRKQVDSRAVAMVRWLDKHPLHEPMNLKDVAAHSGLSINQASRVFIRQFGITPFQYHEKRKLKEAYMKLQHTATPMKEIAYELGFRSPSHFSSWFLAKTDYTPRDYRNAQKGE